MNRPELTMLSEEDLVGASNKLTVRRAQKDLDEQMLPESVTEDGQDLSVVWSDATCTFGPDGFLAATCTCPSRKCCRHRVRTVLYLIRTDTVPKETFAAPGDYDLDDLRTAAGSALWRKACSLMVRGLETQIESQDLVMFPTLGIRVRLAPGLPIDAAMCTCGATELCEHRLVAALSFFEEIPEVHAQPLEEIRATCELLWPRLVELFDVGLISLPVESAGDLRLVSRQIKSTLPRAADDLKDLAKLIEANARRSARFNPTTWLYAASRLAVRLMALGTEHEAITYARRLHLIGRNHRDYIEAASLELWALGAEGFASARGSLLRVWLIQPDTGTFFHVNVGRSGTSPTPPSVLWKSKVLWGDQIPAKICGRSVHLLRPRRTPDGAISSSRSTSATVSPQNAPELASLPSRAVAESKEALVTRWSERLPPLLRPPQAATMTTIIACDEDTPLAASPTFDPQTQKLLVPLNLAQGGTITLEVPHRPGHDTLLENLSEIERWPSQPTHWLVHFRPTAQGLRAAPVSCFFKGEDLPHSPRFSTIDLLDKTSIKPGTVPKSESTDPIDAALGELLAILTRATCNGLARQTPHQHDRFDEIAGKLSRFGLTYGTTAIDRLLYETDPEKAIRTLAPLVAWATALQELHYLSNWVRL